MCETANNESPPVEPEAEDVRIERIVCDEAGKLTVHLVGRDEPIADARVARCFPWSLPEGYISVRDSDGREIVLLESLADLDEASREVVAEELRHKIFRPKITRVMSCRMEFGVTSISAETDRGEVTFQISSRDDVRLLSSTRALFHDVDGNTYELPDVDALDPESKRKLHALL